MFSCHGNDGVKRRAREGALQHVVGIPSTVSNLESSLLWYVECVVGRPKKRTGLVPSRHGASS
jgi:hypothetical protein